MTKSTTKLTPKVMLLASLGIVIPLFILGIAFLAVKSDEKNQQKYAQQRAEMNERINAAVAAEKLKAKQDQQATPEAMVDSQSASSVVSATK